MSTILITGTTGFVGSALTEKLRAGHQVLELNRTLRQSAMNSIAWDFRNPLPPDLPDSVDVVIHAAAVNSDCAADCFAVNTSATAQVLEYAQAAGARTFVYFSTGSVYGFSAHPHQESDLPQPQGAYACSKAAGEYWVQAYRPHFRALSLRLFYPYGPGQRRNRLIPRLIEHIEQGKAIRLNGSAGHPVINPLYIDDLTLWVSRLLKCGASGTYNLAGREQTSIHDLAERIGSLLKLPVYFEHAPESCTDMVGDATEVRRATGQLPKWSLTQGLTKMIHQRGEVTPAGTYVREY